MVHKVINLMMEKVIKHRDIVSQANILKKLQSGKVRREKKRSRHIGEARVLIYKHIHEASAKIFLCLDTYTQHQGRDFCHLRLMHLDPWDCNYQYLR